MSHLVVALSSTLMLQEEEIRNIIQIQFTDWPDHGVPKVA